MKFSKQLFLQVLLSLVVIATFAQDGTRSAADSEVQGKVMIVPFEPLMYMSQIDRKVHEETSWGFEQIRENFRRAFDQELKYKLKSSTSVISFYSDSVRMAKDLDYIYHSRSLAYESLSEDARKVKQEKPKNITNGQLTVAMNDQERFMNAKVSNPNLLADIHRKYKVDYFIFINQLDIVPDMNSYDFATDSYKRSVMIHYTIMDLQQKELGAGIAKANIPYDENNPKKIASKAFKPIVKYISDEFFNAVRLKGVSDSSKK